MSDEHYDVVVVGGGIHGVGVAQAAAAAGYSVLVLEQTALASGTSSRSSKLIHGGLRYLESAQFALVRECLHERELLLKLAPELVQRRRFYIPVYRHTSRRPWQIRAGLSLYATLSGMSSSATFRTIPRQSWTELDGLRTDGLQTVFQYWDAQTDDAELTKAVMQSAVELGARLCAPAVFRSATLTDNGCDIAYEDAGQTKSCRAKVVINAAGPWVNSVLGNFHPHQTGLDVDLVQGAHILLNGQVTHGIYYMEAPSDRRAVFVMPWKSRVLVGTTETGFHNDPADVHALESEVQYLLETLRFYFPVYKNTTSKDVVSEFAGLRVLLAGNQLAFKRPRETVLHVDRSLAPKLLTIYGGKLTAYRATARKVMQRIDRSLPERRAVADTARLPLKPA
ncbi:MAG: glycerol-3-phosphate dehydrogenase [Gammaproteobacteria bacterium]|nr:MAG: glycerol-3-phosphate dehydrogenase [Gammaproteobacteria bacterium]TND06891.1 MAG: glycerol-3-phosphate dehydrogenase [Gammaproteobacteria bacterium]